MVEGETKGNLDLITVAGDNAKIETIKGGFDGPVSLVQVGDQIYVLDVPLRYLLGPEAKEKKAPTAVQGVKALAMTVSNRRGRSVNPIATPTKNGRSCIAGVTPVAPKE